MVKTYSERELFCSNKQREYRSDAKEAAFLLGGIGTGNVSLGARGEFRDWEIFNSPAKGMNLPYSFFSIWAKKEGEHAIARILEARHTPPFSKSHGFSSAETAGLPRLESSVLRSEYPFAWVDFCDKELPVSVSLEAFTPFIPLNADDSGIPGAVIRYKVKNISEKTVEVTIAGSLANAVGFDGYDPFGNPKVLEDNKNEFRQEGIIRGLYYTSPGLSENHLKNGSMALITTNRDITYKKEWLDGNWYDGIQDFWDDFSTDGRLEPVSGNKGIDGAFNNRTRLKVGSLGACATLSPREEAVFEFIITWYFPNRIKAWNGVFSECEKDYNLTVRNYYSTLFGNAWIAGKYLAVNLDTLEKQSRDFRKALYGSSLPWYVIDAAVVGITVIRSCTCFRIEDGTFLAWEGCFDNRGCCEGSCTHVWNYGQTLAFLFPELEHTMRRVEFGLETDENGKMSFRAMKIFGHKEWDFLPAADGQLGTIIRLYRDWKYSGDDKLLTDLWGKARKALDYAEQHWDEDGDHVLDSRQHNTYDIEFYGISSLTNSIYFAALKAASEIERYLGNTDRAIKYEKAWKEGSKKMDKLLWRKDYYIQDIEDVDRYCYQYGTGCLSDQVLGQQLAHVAGLGYILPEEHVKNAVYSVFNYNFKTDFKHHVNAQRTFVLNDEKGLVLCTWPEGGRPKLPFVYSDEVWTGIEYQVAAHLIYEGYINEGLTLVKAVRERHDGYRRNPWNEVECGHHYARSTASWALITALSGFKYDMVAKKISFEPVINKKDFSTFFSTGKAWGIYTQKENSKTGRMERNIEVLYGSLEGIEVN
jgi:non-lysosomal glucosylceramidase